MVRLLLWKDAQVDLKTATGWTALHEATKNSSLEIIDVLLHRGENFSNDVIKSSTIFSRAKSM